MSPIMMSEMAECHGALMSAACALKCLTPQTMFAAALVATLRFINPPRVASEPSPLETRPAES